MSEYVKSTSALIKCIEHLIWVARNDYDLGFVNWGPGSQITGPMKSVAGSANVTMIWQSHFSWKIYFTSCMSGNAMAGRWRRDGQ